MQTNIPRKINTGMWVMADGRVGILTNAAADATVDLLDENGETVVNENGETVVAAGATVDLVDEAGETVVAVQVPFESLRQAMLGDIPTSRRPDPEAGARLGYL